MREPEQPGDSEKEPQVTGPETVVDEDTPAKWVILVFPPAKLYLDGAYLGNSPTLEPFAIPPGPHKLACRMHDGTAVRCVFTAAPGAHCRLKLWLDTREYELEEGIAGEP